jgi:hypothetical protein
MGDSFRLATILRDHFGERQNLMGVEVGVSRGETSGLLLREFPRLTLYMVDPWGTYDTRHPYRKSGDSCAALTEQQQQDNYEAAERATLHAASRRLLVRLPSHEAAHDFASRGTTGFDFAFVDGDHTLSAVQLDIRSWWPLVRSGGLLVGHDIDHPRDRRGLWGVRLAVEEHERQTGVPFDVRGSCWWFVKP